MKLHLVSLFKAGETLEEVKRLRQISSKRLWSQLWRAASVWREWNSWRMQTKTWSFAQLVKTQDHAR